MITISSHGNNISSALPNRRASFCVCSSAVMLGMSCHKVYANSIVVWEMTKPAVDDLRVPHPCRVFTRQGGVFDFRCDPLQTSQEVQQVLLLRTAQRVVIVD